MSIEDIIRAWKDEEYRNSLSEADQAQLPEHPSGLTELTDTETNAVKGGFFSFWDILPDGLWGADGPARTVDGPVCKQNTTDLICRTTKGGPECKTKDTRDTRTTSFFEF
jgi:mersacidin/lichenicidin family type 2 lantibiotic